MRLLYIDVSLETMFTQTSKQNIKMRDMSRNLQSLQFSILQKTDQEEKNQENNKI